MFLGRISALELQIARAEGARRDVEFKLTAIHSHMRRTLGIGRDAANPSSPGRKTQTETDAAGGEESLLTETREDDAPTSPNKGDYNGAGRLVNSSRRSYKRQHMNYLALNANSFVNTQIILNTHYTLKRADTHTHAHIYT